MQRVLEDLLLQSQVKDLNNTSSTVPLGISDSNGKLDMSDESTACLAAASPVILNDLPDSFQVHHI